MSELPAPRCPRCKTVLSPQGRICVVCKTPIQAVPSVNPTTKVESVLKAGDRLVYREDGTKHLKDGRVQQFVVQRQHLSITLESGKTIQGRQVCSIATNREGAITAARAVREEDLLMTTSAPPISAETENQTSRPPRSAWYQHWKDIAVMTVGILPHEPRLTTIMTMIDRCTAAFEKNDEPAFLRAKVQLANFIKASTPRGKPAPALTSPPAAQSA